MAPMPLQAGQAPSGRLKEKCEVESPVTAAKRWRTTSERAVVHLNVGVEDLRTGERVLSDVFEAQWEAWQKSVERSLAGKHYT